MSSTALKNILLRVSYNGAYYNGFAYQPGLPTIEWFLFQALYQSKMVKNTVDEIDSAENEIHSAEKTYSIDKAHKKEYILSDKQIEMISARKYAKCGRTDAGVSASAQYISLFLPYTPNSSSFYTLYPYDLILNQFLPENIRILGYMSVYESFSARFCCLWREYEYYFVQGSLDIEKMSKASRFLLGTHWFGRLSKKEKEKSKRRRQEIRKNIQDSQNIQEKCKDQDSYRNEQKDKQKDKQKDEAVRTIDSITFEQQRKNVNTGEEIFCMRIRARSFLHNQVRKIFSLLRMVGEGANIDVESILCRNTEPKYTVPLAPAYPLVLTKCAFMDVCLQDIVSSKKSEYIQKKIYQKVLIESEVAQKVAGDMI